MQRHGKERGVARIRESSLDGSRGIEGGDEWSMMKDTLGPRSSVDGI